MSCVLVFPVCNRLCAESSPAHPLNSGERGGGGHEGIKGLCQDGRVSGYSPPLGALISKHPSSSLVTTASCPGGSVEQRRCYVRAG